MKQGNTQHLELVIPVTLTLEVLSPKLICLLISNKVIYLICLRLSVTAILCNLQLKEKTALTVETNKQITVTQLSPLGIDHRFELAANI